jgi:hypothetical protein
VKSKQFVLTLSAIALLCLVHDAAAIRILVYDDDTAQHLARDAAISIAPLGPLGTTVATASSFNSQLINPDLGPWDTVAVDCPGNTPTGGWGVLVDYVNAGGSVILSYWDWDSQSALRQAFGIDGTLGKLALFDGVTNFIGLGNGIDLGIFNGVDSTNNDWINNWADDGDRFDLSSSGALGIGTVSGGIAMARKSNGNAIACFLLDEAGPTWVTDARNLWKNMILHVAKSTCSLNLVVDLSPGTGPPPATLGPYQMTPFPIDTPCPPDSVQFIPSPLGGQVFPGLVQKRSVVGGAPSACLTWPSWSHGYTGDVFRNAVQPPGFEFLDTYILMPPNTGAFSFYAQPLGTGVQSLGVRLDDGTLFEVPISGDGGARYIGVYAVGGVVHEIELFDPIGQTYLWAVGEFAIAPAAQVSFSGEPETGAPPATLGPYVMIPFQPLPCSVTEVESIPAPILGDLAFSALLQHTQLGTPGSCGPWESWSHGYGGDVYSVDAGDSTLTIFPPPLTGALSFYVQPDGDEVLEFIVTTNDGATTSGLDAIDGQGGAEYFGFYAVGGGEIISITIELTDGDGFAVGEFAIAQTNCVATCVGDSGADGIVNGIDLANLLGSWTGSATYERCPPFLDGDLNGDCKINGIDLAILLGAWGPC